MSAIALSQYHSTGAPVYEGVTTVWLLATLGNASRSVSTISNSGSSSVKKKDILGVSIPQTCEVIQSNDLHLPLRYVSNLLYGVTVCYHRKTEYVLNDVTGLVTQLQKKMYSGGLFKKRKIKDNDAQSTTIMNPKRSSVVTNAFLDDDPSFDINEASVFANVLNAESKRQDSESSIIRRQDYMNELTNSNNFDKPDYFASLNRPNRSVTLDDIPIDFDFNFELDEIVSRQGTAMGSSTDSVRSNNDLNVTYDDREFALNFDQENSEINATTEPIADDTGINLGITEDLREEEKDLIGREQEPVAPLSKKLDLMSPNVESSSFKNIQVDERIGLSTDILRNNHNNYAEMMNTNRRIIIKARKISSDLSTLDDGNNTFLTKCWSLIFTNAISYREKFSIWPVNTTVERGRKRARSSVDNATSRSSSDVSSEEQGRRAVIFPNENALDNDGDLMLNLEQIDEELNENSSRSSSSHARQHDLLRINLNLPSSSFGRVQTRSNTNTGTSSVRSYERDVVDELYERAHCTNKNDDVPEDSPITRFRENSSQVVLDSQTKRFYDYVKSRSVVVGKRTNTSPLFSKKMLFEDLVPSKISELEGQECPRVLERKIAANAFLSLLNLATKNMIAIKEYNEHSDDTDRYELMDGDDIIIYV
ncbi:hypothetical protein HG535_0H01740 [Zygotorulaspora mrakii]|uniref:Rad21/Rec8-like protein N-terminal domain-containing protein n=1 Tax=Zygotorulaspora mrakii TaxID=42260 RepID=A0A7H9B8B1_ZYGMR|nr:uncharacterized protein HG535_0H01740 [Zygotorulaspora mrakii]QLG74847.1 hypothetical protein HG535_0H01740 [Zygotorulaspora mrakii]